MMPNDRQFVESALSQMKMRAEIEWFTKTESGVYKLSVNCLGKIYFCSNRNLIALVSSIKSELRNPKNYPERAKSINYV